MNTIRVTVFAAVTLAIAGCAGSPPPGAPRVSGHVEATEIHVASEASGRITELRVDEGDRVNAGDVLAILDARDTEIHIQRARADRQLVQAQLRLLEAGPRDEDVRQAEAQVAAARSDVAAVDAEIAAAEIDQRRFESLLESNAGSVKQRDDAKARVDIARDRQRSVQERVEVAQRTVERVKSGARREELDAARARIASADAQLALLEKGLADARVIAPASGIVTLKLVDAGEIVARGAPLVVVSDIDHAWANLFVSEPLVPRLTLGQAATVFTDAGGPGVPGRVTFISPRAEFTPRNVQTIEERSKLVYRIKVSVDNRQGLLKPGMPVDAELVIP